MNKSQVIGGLNKGDVHLRVPLCVALSSRVRKGRKDRDQGGRTLSKTCSATKLRFQAESATTSRSSSGLPPWGRAQLVFAYDSRYAETPPRSAAALAKWIGANPGRFSYPQPPDFTGTSFLKQIALELAPDKSVFMMPAETADKDAALGPLWQWLETVHPDLWRGGTSYPANYTDMVQLLGDGELSFAMAFNPAEFSNGIASGVLPETVRS